MCRSALSRVYRQHDRTVWKDTCTKEPESYSLYFSHVQIERFAAYRLISLVRVCLRVFVQRCGHEFSESIKITYINMYFNIPIYANPPIADVGTVFADNPHKRLASFKDLGTNYQMLFTNIKYHIVGAQTFCYIIRHCAGYLTYAYSK